LAVSSPGSITLDDLVALNDEIKALVRAGVPLEKGLRSLGPDLPGRLGRLAQSLGERLERGENFSDVLEAGGDGFPRAYRAVVAAGIRSGRLSAALEGISTAARRASELRRVMIVSLVYPLAVLAVASVVLLFTALKTGPVVAVLYDELLRVEKPWWYQQLDKILAISPQLLVGFWVIAVVAGVIWLYRSSRASALNANRIKGLPTVGRVLHAGRMATFADVLAMMIEQQVPLDEAIVLSAEASGDRLLQKTSHVLSERIRDGNERIALPDGFPTLLGWLIVGGAGHDQLAKSLRQTAASYRRRALNMGNWLTLYLPIILSAGIGGSIALFYVLVVMMPFCNLLYRLSLA
jgi:general secretion pathway protein F